MRIDGLEFAARIVDLHLPVDTALRAIDVGGPRRHFVVQRAKTGVLSDQTIELSSARGRKVYPDRLRRIRYWDRETRRSYVFLTNNTTWVAKTIADVYKSRWQIELFFKWIKQHLKVKRFVGRSKNAVLTQLWVATCMYLLLAYLKFVMRLGWSLYQMLQVLGLLKQVWVGNGRSSRPPQPKSPRVCGLHCAT